MKLKPIDPKSRLRLRDRDAHAPKGHPSEEDLESRLGVLTERIDELQRALYAEGKRSLLVVLQGRDGSGKDGVARKVFGPLDPQGCHVTSFKAPTEDELAHDFLWRVHRATPARGVIGLFNRSHYEDVLVVRVESLVPPKVWKRRYEQINHFERMLAENGTTVLKFFLHISRDEQKERMLARLDDPTKNWKFDAGDLAVRAKWDDYTAAYQEALTRCSTPWAPWYLVPADDKDVRNYLIARTVYQTLRKMKPKYPKADPEVLALRDTIV